jgi:hypothetical protein
VPVGMAMTAARLTQAPDVLTAIIHHLYVSHDSPIGQYRHRYGRRTPKVEMPRWTRRVAHLLFYKQRTTDARNKRAHADRTRVPGCSLQAEPARVSREHSLLQALWLSHLGVSRGALHGNADWCYRAPERYPRCIRARSFRRNPRGSG